MDASDIKTNIQNSILKSVAEHELFGRKNIWQDYMQREIYSSFPKEQKFLIDDTINDLLEEEIFEKDDKGYIHITKKGQDLVYLDDLHLEGRLKNKVLIYLRDNNYFANSVWKRMSYLSFCEKELVVNEKYIFEKTIDEMIDEGIFSCDKDYNLVLTQLGQNMIYLPTNKGTAD